MPRRRDPCKCCGLTRQHFTPRKPVNGLPMALIVCDLCARHQGSDVHDLRKRERVHQEMAAEHERELLEDLTRAHETEKTRLEAEIQRLETELEERPVQVVNEYIGQDIIDEAEDFAQRAYRSRDRAYRLLAELHMLHFEVGKERCRCGRSIAECKEVGILDDRGLRTWELKQSDRRRRLQHHLLPNRHPGVIDARWDPDSPEAQEFDEYHPRGA